jgi:hypothetical protein
LDEQHAAAPEKRLRKTPAAPDAPFRQNGLHGLKRSRVCSPAGASRAHAKGEKHPNTLSARWLGAGLPRIWGRGQTDPKSYCTLVLLFTSLLTIPLTRERFLHAPLFARFQVEGMTLHFLDDVFLLNLALKPAQRIFKRLAFLNANLGQRTTPPDFANWALTDYRNINPFTRKANVQIAGRMRQPAPFQSVERQHSWRD